MKAQELKQALEILRNETETAFKENLLTVKELYVKETGSEECPTGVIELPTYYIHQWIDDQTNEVINGIYTEGDSFVLDSGYDVNVISLKDVNIYVLMEIVSDLEDMIGNPGTIDINVI